MRNPFQGASGSKKVQRAVDGVKILVDVASESSDWFPPLKSALGGVNALIKHYEQYKDVKEKAAQLVPWLEKLKDNLASVADGVDCEEKQRRAELSSSLGEIGERSKVLLEKKKTSRFFDKGKDAQEVANLVEELRNAIVYYQVSQQQSIYNRIGELTSSFEKLLGLHQKSPVTKRKIEAAFARFNRLGSREDDKGVADSMRRAEFFTTLNRIKHKFQEILDRVEVAGYSENDEDTQIVSELMDDVRDAIIDCQTAHQQVIYDQNLELINRAEMSVLNSCHRAHGAGYQHGNRNGCLNGTRESVLDEIERWTEDFDKSPIFWLNGLAGTGKSTIAQTIAERLFADDRLGASFFCSRSFEDRSNLRLVFPTLAFQLAQKYPKFRSSLVPLLQFNPDIDHESLLDQMQKLLVKPLRSANISTVIVIDALDECKDDEPESAILLVLGKSVSEIPGVKFIITSRPEARITSGFRGPLLKDSTDIFVLHKVEPRTIGNDIRRFFKHELSGVAHRCGGSEDWPTDEQLDSLCRRAAGFFVYAVATVNFLKHGFKRPSDRLNTIMKSPESTAHEGGVELKVYASLDSLYTSILREAFRKNGDEDNGMVRSVLSAVVLVTNPLSPSVIAALMGFECDEVVLLLESIQSLLTLHEDIDDPVRPFHKSFPDFITDPTRCTDPRFYISSDYHTELFLHFLERMGKSLKKNICSLPDYVLNSEVEDLPEKIEESGIRGALEHVCRSWDKHLIVTKHRTSDVLSALGDFLGEKFVFWLEVLSVVGAVGDAARALSAAVKWLNEIQVSEDANTLLDTTTDFLRFVAEFFEVISQSAPQIYHSALLLAPYSSVVRKLYGQHIHPHVSRVVTGIPTSWDSCTASAGAASEVGCAVWSPCGRLVAVGMGNVVEVRDSSILERLSTLKTPATFSPAHSISFSLDGRLLACLQWERELFPLPQKLWLHVWDVQTGVMIRCVHVHHSGEITFSGNGNQRVVNLLHHHSFSKPYQFYIYDALKDTQPKADLVPSFDLRPYAHWTRKDTLHFATSFKIDGHVLIEIRELQQTSHPLPAVESFRVPLHSGGFSFSPVSFHASFVAETDLVILDVRDSRILLEVKAAQSPFIPPGHFSSDGRFFICRTEEPRIFVWENGSTGYGPWSNLRPRLLFKGLSFSPTMSSILTWGPQGIQVLNPGNRSAFLSPNEAGHHHGRRNHLVAYSADGALTATARHKDHVIKVLDNLSGSPCRLIDTGMEILDIKIVNNAICMASSCGLIWWDLETGERARGAQDIIDSTMVIDPTANHLALSHDCSQVAFVVPTTQSYMRLRRAVPPTEVCLWREGLPPTRVDLCEPQIFDTGDLVPVINIQSSPNQHGLWLLVTILTQSLWDNTPSTLYLPVELEILEDGSVRKVSKRSFGSPWPWVNLFSCGYGICIGSQEWVVDPEGRKVLWLSPSWRAKNVEDVRWDGNFLAFLHGHHPDPIIIQFRP